MWFVSLTSRGQGLLLRCRILGLCRNAARLGKQEAWRWWGGMTPVSGGESSHSREAAACRLCIERRPCPVSFDSAPHLRGSLGGSFAAAQWCLILHHHKQAQTGSQASSCSRSQNALICAAPVGDPHKRHSGTFSYGERALCVSQPWNTESL